MTKLKASNVFDFFAPTGGGSKIADFGSALKNATSTPSVSPSASGNTGGTGTSSGPSSGPIGNVGAATPNHGSGPKKDYTWAWVLLGAVVIGGGIYLINRHNKKKEVEDKKGL